MPKQYHADAFPYRTLENVDWSACANAIDAVKALVEKHQIEINHDQKHNTPADLILAGMIMMEEMIVGNGTPSIDGYQMFVDGDYNNEMEIIPYNDKT